VKKKNQGSIGFDRRRDEDWVFKKIYLSF